jgi:hypothetical protein
LSKNIPKLTKKNVKKLSKVVKMLSKNVKKLLKSCQKVCQKVVKSAFENLSKTKMGVQGGGGVIVDPPLRRQRC